MNPVYIIDAVRTPRGKGNDKGRLHALKPVELARQALVALVERSGVDATHVEDVLLGCVTQTDEQGANIAKTAAMLAEFPVPVSAATVNRFCASGLSAVNLAAASIAAGQAEMVIAGGVESTSRVHMFSDKGAWFADPEIARKTKYVHMGVSADLCAALRGVTREEVDAYAADSQVRAAKARAEGRFAAGMFAVKNADGEVVLDQDELIRGDTTAEDLAKLPALFGGAHGARRAEDRAREADVEIEPIHHLGNSPRLADGACAVLLASESALERWGLAPCATITGAVHYSADPVEMLSGNGPSIDRMLSRIGWKHDSVDRYEVNESFAGVMVALQRDLDADRERFNPDGGAIALGHALGATGAMLLSTALDGLGHSDGKRGVVSVCGGAGVVASLAFERMD